MRYLALVLLVVLAGVVGWMMATKAHAPDIEGMAHRVEDQINKIAQFATAEGLYSRMYRYNDEGSTKLFQFTDKKFLVRADARVVYGFDFDSVQVDTDYGTQRLILRGWPEPSQLSFEYDTEFFDITEGLFASIDKDDLNRVNQRVRERIAGEVDAASLQAQSYEQADALLGIIRSQLEEVGWELEVEGWPAVRRLSEE